MLRCIRTINLRLRSQGHGGSVDKRHSRMGQLGLEVETLGVWVGAGLGLRLVSRILWALDNPNDTWGQ